MLLKSSMYILIQMCSEEGAFLAIWTQLTRGLQQVSGKEDTLRQWDGVINTSVLSRLWSTSRGRTKRLHISLTIIVFWPLWTPWRLFPVRRDFPFWCWHISLRRQWRWHIALFASFRRPNHEITGFKPKKSSTWIGVSETGDRQAASPFKIQVYSSRDLEVSVLLEYH